MQKSFGTPGPTSMYVEIASGEVHVRAAEVTETLVDVSGKDAGEVVVESRGEQIVVIGPQRRGGFLGSGHSLHVTVVMPTDSELATKLGSADLVVSGRLSATRVRSGSGDVQLDVVDSEADLESGSGDITVEEVTGNLRARTGSGEVSVERLGGSASVSTGSGDVEIGSATGDVQAKTGSGDLRVRDAKQDVSLSTASGDLTVDLISAGQLQAKNVSGDIRVGVPEGVPVWTDISTVTGAVESDLDGAGQPVDGQAFLTLRAKTVSGDIYLEQR
ncbi:hypothetical protein BH18ACT9_BH18ACT9_21130 [soil metagenome]